MVVVIYQKTENCKEAINKVLIDLRARDKVQVKHFKVKMAGVCYI